jgi:hypothetical protein
MAFSEETKQAARHLNSRFSGQPWLSSVGITEEAGRPVLLVYLSKHVSKSQSGIPDIWEGVPVRTQYIGKVRPAAAA